MLSLRGSICKHLSPAWRIVRKESRLLSVVTEATTPSTPVGPASATHMLTFPMYANNPELWAKMEEFREILIKDAPKTGLDPSTVMPNIKPVLEYKLGRLIIKDDSTRDSNIPNSCEHSEVMKILEGLKEPIRKVLSEKEIEGYPRLPLGDVRPRNKNNKALLLHPIRSKELTALVAINALVYSAFKNEGFLLTRYRAPGTTVAKVALAPIRGPLYLSSTIINSGYAKDRKLGEPQKSFDLDAVYTSSVFKPWPPTDQSPQGNAFTRRVELGDATIPGLYLRRCDSFSDSDSRELVSTAKLDFADC